MKKIITLSVFLVMSILGLVLGYNNLKVDEILENTDIKIPTLFDSEPVVANLKTISKPFKDVNVEVIVDYYDVTKENGEKSIIVINNNTYIPNKGILYKNDKKFDIISIYDGEVIEVGKDELTGNYVKINHDNDLVSTYRIIDNIKVAKGDHVKSGDTIAISSTGQLEKGNLLLFELQYKGNIVNPSDYYNKSKREI